MNWKGKIELRIAVVSDTHREVNKAIKALLDLGDFDCLFHAGDFYEDFLKLKAKFPVNITGGVRGNCDSHNYPERLIIDIFSYRILLVHGHQYNVKNGLNSLKFATKETEADIVIFGHTHVALSETDCDKDVLYFNPGSVLLETGKKSSIGLIEIGEKDKTIDTKIIKLE